MGNYEDGVAAGYRIGAYGVDPDGNWLGGEGYDMDRMADDGYRKGLQDGRTWRIDDAGQDPEVLLAQAREAYLRQQGGAR